VICCLNLDDLRTIKNTCGLNGAVNSMIIMVNEMNQAAAAMFNTENHPHALHCIIMNLFQLTDFLFFNVRK